MKVCNWAVPPDDPNPLCVSCRLTRVIPDLAVRAQGGLVSPRGREAAAALHAARRSELPVDGEPTSPAPAWCSSSWPIHARRPPVLTGHADGIITVNVAEADDAEREQRRHALRGAVPHAARPHPPRDRPLLLGPAGRAHGDALDAVPRAVRRRTRGLRRGAERHYDAAPPADWQERFVSAYASAHPWEDWAETWAHYLHMTDTLETAARAACRCVRARSDEPSLRRVPASSRRRRTVVRSAARQLVPADLRAEQPQSRPRACRTPIRSCCRRRRSTKLRFVHEVTSLQAKHGAKLESALVTGS